MSSAKDEHRCQCQSYPEIILILIFILILYYTIIYSTILNYTFFSIIQQCTRHGFGVPRDERVLLGAPLSSEVQRRMCGYMKLG